MTERDRLKDAVVEAAEILAHSCGVIRGRTPEDDDIYTVELEHIRELNAAIAALNALPATAATAGEVVEVVVWESVHGEISLVTPNLATDNGIWQKEGSRRLGVVRLPVVAADVEGV